jgi:hypothetical protein
MSAVPQSPTTTRTHFKLYFYAAVIHAIHQISAIFESQQAAFEQFPFLIGYINELAAYGLQGQTTSTARKCWRDVIANYERTETGYMPLKVLCKALDLSPSAVNLWFIVGLAEEDPRFGLLFEALHGIAGQHRPSLGLLETWWRDSDDGSSARDLITELQQAQLIQITNPDAPRIDWALEPITLLWDMLRRDHADTRLPEGLTYRTPDTLLSLNELILSDELGRTLARVPALLESGEVRTLIVRGQQHNGRKTLIGALARMIDQGQLVIEKQDRPDKPPLPIGLLATLLRAVPTFTFDLTPGETAKLPPLHGYDGFVSAAMSQQGGLENGDQALTLRLGMPDVAARREHWRIGFEGYPVVDLNTISTRYRMTGGSIRGAAKLARAYARMKGAESITAADVQEASHSLNQQALDRMAVYVPPVGDWRSLAVNEATLEELHHLVSRCHHRETLHSTVNATLGAQMNAGVRALFTGPTGTGKTLAARVVAGVLQMDLFRLDLATVVNKFIGETEKNLNIIFNQAEARDVIVLIDEGDALMTQRTNVQSSNDRYANLETNYLLQRLESYEGIVLITTNASDRIDNAFQRRMDVVVEFRAPDVNERWAILMLHLPPDHAVDDGLLREIASRCMLMGGQIRNIVLHASILALEAGSPITASHLDAAVRREYRKSGAVCPLRSLSH